MDEMSGRLAGDVAPDFSGSSVSRQKLRMRQHGQHVSSVSSTEGGGAGGGKGKEAHALRDAICNSPSAARICSPETALPRLEIRSERHFFPSWSP